MSSVLEQNAFAVSLSAALIFLFGLAEIRWPAASRGPWRGAALNVFIGICVGLIAAALALPLIWLVRLIPDGGLLGLIVSDWRDRVPMSLAVSVLLYGFVWDFFQYWFHRAQHSSALLWPAHRVHHSDAQVNTTTALRRSVIELVLIYIFILLPTIVTLGIEPVSIAVAFAIFYGWGFFNHANIRFRWGALTKVLSGPQWHRLHHAEAPELHDRNFAAYFPVLDIVFGTYAEPRGLGPVPTGVEGPHSGRALSDVFLPRR